MWTEELTDKLKAWAGQGVSYGIIAKRLGVTRNAVIGKASREKLPPRIGNIREMAFRKRVEADQKRVAKSIRAQEREREKALKKSPKTEVTSDIKALIAIPTNGFLNQPRGYCCWPHGEVCKHKATQNSYCEEHHARSRRAD
jgi:GcrA cell cycle regulator